MRVLVCGSRHFDDIDKMSSVLTEVDEENRIDVLIHGAARGADTLAEQWAFRHDREILDYPANWDKYKKAAGPIRNTQMLKEGKPDLVVAFMAQDSRGTKNMVEQATKAGVEVKIINVG